MFPFSGSSIVKTMIYFDNAATTFPKPRTILPALQNAVLYYGGNPGRSGHTISMKTSEKVFEVRKKAAEFFNAEVENTIFATNCTHALNMAIKGVMKSGHAVTSCLEHNSVLRPLYALQKNGIITYNVADMMGNDQQILTEIEKKHEIRYQSGYYHTWIQRNRKDYAHCKNIRTVSQTRRKADC